MDIDALLDLIKTSLDAEDEITQDSSQDNIPEWDSLGHLSILSALDEATNGKAASITELAEATSVSSILEILKSESLL